jgi:hypothetical protein
LIQRKSGEVLKFDPKSDAPEIITKTKLLDERKNWEMLFYLKKTDKQETTETENDV